VVDLKRTAGVVIGLVTDLEDPDGLGRVKVKFPWLPAEPESNWCRVSTPLAGNGHGLYFAPEVDSEALVAFEHGDFNCPYIVGYLWSGETELPEAELSQRLIKSVKGNSILLDDTDDAEGITISDKHGNTIVMNKDGIEIKGKTITILSEGELKAEGDPIQLNP
jgi:uncharacterized protein involved in type VI secretion and phage assembly